MFTNCKQITLPFAMNGISLLFRPNIHTLIFLQKLDSGEILSSNLSREIKFIGPHNSSRCPHLSYFDNLYAGK